jgi:BirA family transcriptional regulator, biotin operon repressor / biotin---[acetyl-CoA-carboxylase] ligase
VSLPPRRDWFGLADFDPGDERRSGFLYLLGDVGSTSDFLLGRGDPATGRLCRWGGWGWQAGDRQMLPPPTHPRDGSIVIARRQADGRGRQGRSWYGDGGLIMSWTISPVPRNHASRLAVWTGLMVVEAVREITGEDVRLKWPNDLWLHGRKLGGMILDLVQRGPERLLVAGLGINIGKWPDTVPDEVLVRATKLDEGVRLSVLIAAILNRHDRERPRFLEEGWPAFRKRLDELDVLRGRTIELRDARGVHQATALGIDDDGALLVDINGQQETVLAGDVHITKA